MGGGDEQRGEFLSGASTIIAGDGGDADALASAGTILAAPTDAESTASDEPPAAASGARRLPAGTRVGRYELAEPLGAGGMGVVYRARDPELDRWLAIKVMRSDRRDRDAGRFQREAQAMARVSHPNVVPIHDVGWCDGGLFLAMELIEGETLRA